MISKFLKELEDRRTFVEKNDLDFDSKNKEHFRGFWLHMIILSSAVVLGILPLLDKDSTIIKSALFAKIGLLLIVSVSLLIIIYFQNTLSREKDLIFEQKFFHLDIFSRQYNLLMQAQEDCKSEEDMQKIFDESKSKSFVQEQNIVASHIIYKKFKWFRLFIDKNFNRLISYLFILGIIFIIISFVWPNN